MLMIINPSEYKNIAGLTLCYILTSVPKGSKCLQVVYLRKHLLVFALISWSLVNCLIINHHHISVTHRGKVNQTSINVSNLQLSPAYRHIVITLYYL